MELLTWLRARWDRALGLGLIALGAVLVLLGYRGASDSPHPVEQLSYLISGGVGGLLALGVGVALVINSDLRDEFRMLERVEAALRPDDGLAPTGEQREEPETEAPEDDITVLLEVDKGVRRGRHKVNH